MSWLNQFFNSSNGFVSRLIADILASRIGDALLYINIMISIICVFFVCQQFIARVLQAGEDGRIRGSNAFAIRLAILPMLCAPVAENGKLSLAQLAVLKTAEKASSFGDFIYLKLNPISEVITISLSSSPSSNSTPAFSYVSADAATTIGKVFSLLFCQYRLTWMDYAYTLPTPTRVKSISGSQVIQFGAPAQLRLPVDVCGSITLPPTTAELADSGIARALNTFSSNRVADSILQTHRDSINSAIDNAGRILATAHPYRGVVDDSLWQRIAGQMRAAATQYESAIAAAGGVVYVKNDGTTTDQGLDDNSFGWLNAGFTLTTRSSQIGGRISALTWRPQIDTQNVNRVYPLTFAPDLYRHLDQDFSNALQQAGLLKTPRSASAGGMSIETFLGVGEVRAAADLLTNPSANVWEVAGTVGPLLTAAAVAGLAAYASVSALIPGVGTFISVALGTMMLAGQSLTIIVQIAPAIAWMFLLLGWFASLFVLFVSGSFYAIALAKDDTDQIFLSGKVPEIFGRIVTVLFTPALLVIGLALIIPVVNLGWFFIVKAISPAVTAAASESAISAAISLIILVLVIVSLISALIYFSLSKIANSPKFLTEILGGHDVSLSAGERVSGSETVSSSPIMGPGGGARQQAPGAGQNAFGGATASGLPGRTANTDKNSLHVAASTKGNPQK